MTKKSIRPPTRKRVRLSTPSYPSISIGTEEKRLLIALSKDNRFSINGYSNGKQIPHSTTRSRLKKLHRIGFIDYSQAPPILLKKGEVYLENTNQMKKKGVEVSRLGGRENDNSTHWHLFSMDIKNKSKFRKEKLDRENCEWVEEKSMNNWNYLVVKFNDATVMIKPKKLEIWLYDIVRKDTDEIDAICLRRLVSYVALFKRLGIETEKTYIEKGHWARIDSALAQWLYKTFEDKYELILEDGSKFYIDVSKNKQGIRKLEEETDKKVIRQRVNKAMDGIGLGKYELDDMNLNTDNIKEIKEALRLITTMEKVRLMDRIERNKLKLEKLNQKEELLKPDFKIIPSYIN